MTDYRILRASDRVPTPWRNGGGVTTEIAVEPAGAGLADFAWRVSTAVVASDGPFSLFPGIDRVLGVLEGDGLILEVEGRPSVRLGGDDAPHAFPGDLPTFGRLAAGTVVDLNLMLRRGLSGTLARHAIDGPATLPGGPGLILWQTGSGRVSTSDGPVMLQAMDAVLCMSNTSWAVDPDGPSRVWTVTIGDAS